MGLTGDRTRSEHRRLFRIAVFYLAASAVAMATVASTSALLL